MNPLLLRLKRCNRDSIRRTGEIDVPELAKHIDRGLSQPREREINLMALAEYVGGALEGVPPDLESIPWKEAPAPWKRRRRASLKTP